MTFKEPVRQGLAAESWIMELNEPVVNKYYTQSCAIEVAPLSLIAEAAAAGQAREAPTEWKGALTRGSAPQEWP